MLKLRADLQKAKDKARMTKEAFGAAEVATFERGVMETEMRLTEEVAGVCKDYCAEV